jgi:hypothetical protein
MRKRDVLCKGELPGRIQAHIKLKDNNGLKSPIILSLVYYNNLLKELLC